MSEEDLAYLQNLPEDPRISDVYLQYYGAGRTYKVSTPMPKLVIESKMSIMKVKIIKLYIGSYMC